MSNSEVTFVRRIDTVVVLKCNLSSLLQNNYICPVRNYNTFAESIEQLVDSHQRATIYVCICICILMFNERVIKNAGGSVVGNRRWFRLIQSPMYISSETAISPKGN